MRFFSKGEIKKLLRAAGVEPSKALGQRFLADAAAFKKILAAARLSPCETALEVGPGVGNLTCALAAAAGKVVAVEKDRAMAAVLKDVLLKRGITNVEIVRGDILGFNFQPGAKNYKVVANLPYYIVLPVIRKFLEAGKPPKLMVLVVQKEVAQRICASPPHMSVLAVSVQFFAKPKIVSYISKKSFWPSPKVDSAIIKITPRALSEILTIVRISDRADEGADRLDEFQSQFFKIVKAGFSQPRKQIANNLKKALALSAAEAAAWLEKSGVDPTRRAESLSVREWLRLARFRPRRF